MTLPFIIRQALATEHEELCALFEELDEHHRRERPDRAGRSILATGVPPGLVSGAGGTRR
jgi:hypothetical protein